jgi:magnesium transporter
MQKYKKISGNIQKVTIDNPKTDNDKLTWVNIFDAGKSEIEYLRKKYKFELQHLQASLGRTVAQRPTISHGLGADNTVYHFMILHFPVFQGGSIVAGEIEFFISDGYLVTLHNNNIEILNEFFNYCKKDGTSLLSYEFESSAILLYEILEKLMLSCYSILDKNSIEISRVEEIIFSQDQKRAVSDLLSLRRNIINFRKIMLNHKNIIKKLLQVEGNLMSSEKISKYYNEIIEHSKRIWDLIESQKDMIDVLNSTNESLLDYKISDIMKTLTIISVIVFPLTLLAAVFGMNFPGIPFTANPHGFWVVISFMVTVVFSMLLFFERKRWL